MFNGSLHLLKHIHLNIIVVDMIRGALKYDKYIKDIVSHKRMFTRFETVMLTKECTSRIQRNLPQKKKDPGSFTIPLRIGKFDVGELYVIWVKYKFNAFISV